MQASGGGKATASKMARWVVLLMIIGSTLAVVVWGLLAGLGDFNIPQSSFFLQYTGLKNEKPVLEKEEDLRCQGRRIYMYDMPPQFNDEILGAFCEEKNMWMDMCESYINDGLGFKMEHVMEPLEAWYRTEQFSVEVVVHERIKNYSCLTNNAESADLFYLPFYVGLDVTRYIFGPEIQLRDLLTERFLGWLMAQPTWTRLKGNNHFLVLGRIVWDFSRQVASGEWGNSILSSFELQNVTKLLIERDPNSREKQIGIPYPTSFHPKSDSELQLWQEKLTLSKRDVLVSFAGAPRDKTQRPEWALRGILFEQCNQTALCRPLLCSEVNCPKNPHFVTKLFLQSTFCLQPPGDSPTRKAVFDCLVAGTIPVFFTEHSAYTQYLWHLPADGDSYSVLLSEKEVIEGNTNVIEALQKIPEEKIKRMRALIIDKIVPSIVYDMPGRDPDKKIKDALDIILENFFVPNFKIYPHRPWVDERLSNISANATT